MWTGCIPGGRGEERRTAESPLLSSNTHPVLPRLKLSQATLKMAHVVPRKPPAKAAVPGTWGPPLNSAEGEAICALELFHSWWNLRYQFGKGPEWSLGEGSVK